MNKTAIIAVLFALLLLSCKEGQKKEICDSSCEMRKEFELSPTRVDFRYINYTGPKPKFKTPAAGGRPREPYPFHINASMTRTATGVLVEVKDEPRIEFNMEDWLDFIRALYKGIDEEKYSRATPINGGPFSTRKLWEIRIYHSNKTEPDEYYEVYKYYNERPNKVIKVIDVEDVIKDMEKKIKRRIEFKKKDMEIKLKAEYQK